MYLLLPPLIWLIDFVSRSHRLVNIASIMAFLLFIFGGKYYNGWDWVNYNLFFDCALPFGETFSTCSPQNLEPGFSWLNRVVKTLFGDVQALYVIIAASQVGALVYFARAVSIRFANLALLWVIVFGWALLMQVLRQGLAVSCLLIAIALIMNRRSGWAAFWAVVAVSMHYSAIIPIGIALVAQGRTRWQQVLGAVCVAGVAFLGTRLGGGYLDDKVDLYGVGVTFNPVRLLRYLLFAPLLWYVYRVRGALRQHFGPKLYGAGVYLTMFGIALLPFIATPWATRLIIYAQVPLILAGAYVISQRFYGPAVRLVMIAPLLIVYAYPYFEPLNAIDVRPLRNYWVNAVWQGEELTYFEAYDELVTRLCAIERCPK